MTVRVGVIGTGMIGQDHIRRLTHVLSGSQVVAVTDADLGRAREVAEALPGAVVHETGHELVRSGDVDAVLVTSWGQTHEEYVLAAIEADKPVFCEKPLATTQQACVRILEAEVAHGSRLVQVGFNRRFDAPFRALKRVIDGGSVGTPLMVHCAHRNASVPPHYTREMAITDTAVHEVDTVRWLLGEEVVATTVYTPRRSRHGGDLQDPLLVLFEMESGALVDVEVSVNIRYGYDIRTEVVGEDGTVGLADASPVLVRQGGSITGGVPADWRERFVLAYDAELQAWLDSVRTREATGPTSWDGYAAAAVTDAGLQALATGSRTPVQLGDRPELYAKSR